VKSERCNKASEEKPEAARDWIMRLKQRICLFNIKAEGETVSAHGEAVESYRDDQA
jgi:hypothetical protein